MKKSIIFILPLRFDMLAFNVKLASSCSLPLSLLILISVCLSFFSLYYPPRFVHQGAVVLVSSVFYSNKLSIF